VKAYPIVSFENDILSVSVGVIGNATHRSIRQVLLAILLLKPTLDCPNSDPRELNEDTSYLRPTTSFSIERNRSFSHPIQSRIDSAHPSHQCTSSSESVEERETHFNFIQHFLFRDLVPRIHQEMIVLLFLLHITQRSPQDSLSSSSSITRFQVGTFHTFFSQED